MGEHVGEHAVVLGASVAGLLAAAAAASAYRRVTVLDRDELPPDGTPRRGVPQGPHVHALLPGGQLAIEELLPGFTAELAAAGVPVGDALGTARMFVHGQLLRSAESGLVSVYASRPELEFRLRERVAAIDGVTIRDGCEALDLVADPDHNRVTGVRLADEVLPAELLVDATGRRSRTPAWLAALGYEAPPVERVEIGIGYSSRWYRLPEGALDDNLMIFIGPTPAAPRCGVLMRTEGDRHLLSLNGRLGDYPPAEHSGFGDYLGTLRFPDIAAVLAGGEPLGDATAYRFPDSVRRRYERLMRLPAGLMVLGDAVCSFNPVYAQGMSVAALEAVALRRHLGRGAEPDPAAFFRDVAVVVNAAWSLSVGGDLAYRGVAGRRSALIRFVNAYLPRVAAAASTDAAIAGAMLRVAGLIDQPQTLMRPRILARALLSRS